MTTLSDAIRAVVGGTSINDGLMTYFAANGGVGTTLPDLERSFLISQLGLSAPVAATTNDLWRQFLVNFTGALPDQLLQFWLAGGAVESWTPAEWFLANEQGAWLDPSDLTTMFQDSAGTTPVTAVEQPVGLTLDKRLGLVLGPELVVNGGFDSNTAWSTSNAAVTISGGRLVFTSAPNISYARQIIAATDGQYCEITIVVASVTSGAVNVQFDGGVGDAINFTSAGTHTVRLRQAAMYSSFYVTSSGANTTAEVESVSVKVISGNHASQATSAARPVLSARVNLLTKTENLSDAVWVKTGVVVSAGALYGTVQGFLLTEDTSNGYHKVMNLYSGGPPAPCVIDLIVKAAGRTKFYIGQYDGDAQRDLVDLVAGTMTNTVPQYSNKSVTPLGDGFYRVRFTTTGSWGSFSIALSNGTTSSYVGDGVSGLYIAAPQIEGGAVFTRYQRVNTATDYDTVGFPHYLKFDGVDDFLSTGSINFTGTDKMTVVTGARWVSGTGMLTVFGAAGYNAGEFYLLGGTDRFTGWNTVSTGSASASTASIGAFETTAPDTAVISAINDIAGDLSRVRRNGVVGVDGTLDKGAGNFANYPLYIGARSGGSLPFNGHIYQLVVRGALTADLAPVETYVADKTGVTLP